MTAEMDTMTVQMQQPDTGMLGKALAGVVVGAYESLPESWSEQARLQVSLEVARYVAAGPLAQALAPQPVYTVPDAPANGTGDPREVHHG